MKTCWKSHFVKHKCVQHLFSHDCNPEQQLKIINYSWVEVFINNLLFTLSSVSTKNVIVFKSKSQKLPPLVLCLGEPPRRFLLHLHFISSLIFILLLCLHFCRCSSFTFHLLFDIIPHPSVDYRRVFTPILYFQPSPSQSDSQYFHFQPFIHSSILSFIFLPRALRFWLGFLPYTPSPTFMTQPAFIKASLGSGSSSLKFAGLHTDPQNTDPAHLFVWFKVIHKLYIQNDSHLSSTIY